MKKRAVHVIPHPKNKSRMRWAVKLAGATKAYRVFNLQSEAIQCGIRIARNQRTELIVHRANGEIRSKDSYGNDPLPVRDKEH